MIYLRLLFCLLALHFRQGDANKLRAPPEGAPPWYDPGIPWWMRPPPNGAEDLTENQKNHVRRRAQLRGRRPWFVFSNLPVFSFYDCITITRKSPYHM